MTLLDESGDAPAEPGNPCESFELSPEALARLLARRRTPEPLAQRLARQEIFTELPPSLLGRGQGEDREPARARPHDEPNASPPAHRREVRTSVPVRRAPYRGLHWKQETGSGLKRPTRFGAAALRKSRLR
ncbi:MAG: hypothetical protein ACK4N5_17700 [Myxococcales bacterium]